MLEAWEDDEASALTLNTRADAARGGLNPSAIGPSAATSLAPPSSLYAASTAPSISRSSAANPSSSSRNFGGGAKSASASSSSPTFDLEIVEGSNLTRNSGEVTCARAANDAIVLGTSQGALVRYDYSDGDQERSVVHLSKSGSHAVTKLFLDRSSMHALACLEDPAQQSLEYVYMNTVTQAPKILEKMRRCDEVQTVAFTNIHSDRDYLAGSGTFTGPMLVGTTQGQIFEYQVDDREKKERSPKLLFELPERAPVLGLDFAGMGEGEASLLVVAITSTRCYFFFAGPAPKPTFESVFARYSASNGGEGLLSFLELPGQSGGGELHVFRNLRQRPQHLAWAAAPGIFHGKVDLDDDTLEDAQTTYHTFLKGNALFDYDASAGTAGAGSATANGGGGDRERPISVEMTEYHFVLLFPRRVVVVNRINERVVHEEHLEGNFKGRALGLMRDETAQIVYLYSTEALYSFEVRNEAQDIWNVYLDKGKYSLALEHCRTVDQRNHVYAMQAKRHMAREEYQEAARVYARVCGQPSFEEICLKFIEIDQFGGLQVFLQERLKKMTSAERTQATMLSTWLTEIYLSAINEAYIRSGRQSEAHAAALAHFRSFLKTFSKHLDETTTSWLLSSYGHIEELIHYASMIEDHETVVQNLIQRDRAEEAIQVLRNPSVPSTLWYKASPRLFLLEPHQTVDAWMIADKLLDPIKLLPSLLKIADQASSDGSRAEHAGEAVRYLEFCIARMGNKDCRVHNLLVSFLGQRTEEGPLLKYLTVEGLSPSGEPYYDAKFALRLCMKVKKVRCCVQLYSMMHLYEEAVNNALHVDLELAKSVADRPEEDAILRKKLWLVVAQHVIEQDKSDKGENIRKAIAFRKETDSLLKVEDILPFFPNFVLIDDFKDAIIQSLEEYNNQIEDLRNEMDEITQGTEALRHDIAAVGKRVVTIPQNETCARCGESVAQIADKTSAENPTGLDKFYVFPSGQIFKTTCLVDILLELSSEAMQRTILSLCTKVPFLMQKPPLHFEVDPEIAAMSTEECCKKLDDILGQENPYCGDLMVKSISKPFITDDEYESGEVESWNVASH